MKRERMHIEGPQRNFEKGVDVYAVRSPYLGATGVVEVLLPDGVKQGERFRTLYVLPVEAGVGGVYGDGLAEVRACDIHNRHRLICATTSFDTLPWYGAHATNPQMRHEQHIREVVVPLVESRYPATGAPADRLLLGFSKSGWGAVSMLLRNPELYGAACSWDAPLMMDESSLSFRSLDHFGTPAQAAAYAPVSLVRQRASLLAQQPARLAILGCDKFAQHTIQYHELLEALRVPHVFNNDLRAEHRWDSGWLPVAVDLFLQHAPPV